MVERLTKTERNNMSISNLKEFMEARGFGEESLKDIERNTYKYTDCGAWIVEKKEEREYAFSWRSQ